MEMIVCPYCECKVRMSDVEDDDGQCPECGARILGSLLPDTDEDDPDREDLDHDDEDIDDDDFDDDDDDDDER